MLDSSWQRQDLLQHDPSPGQLEVCYYNSSERFADQWSCICATRVQQVCYPCLWMSAFARLKEKLKLCSHKTKESPNVTQERGEKCELQQLVMSVNVLLFLIVIQYEELCNCSFSTRDQWPVMWSMIALVHTRPNLLREWPHCGDAASKLQEMLQPCVLQTDWSLEP